MCVLAYIMNTSPEPGVGNSARVRRLTLGLGILQLILGVALTVLSFITFFITDLDRLRNSCPYWAGIIVRNCIRWYFTCSLASLSSRCVPVCMLFFRLVIVFLSLQLKVCLSGAVGISAWKRSSTLWVGFNQDLRFLITL